MLTLNFSPFPRLETKRLILRRITNDDVDELFELRTNAKAMQYIGKKKPSEPSEIYTLINTIDNDIENNTAISWAICLKEQSKLIGTIGYYRNDFNNYRGEIGYMLLPDYWRKGIMSEAISTALNFGFNEMKFHSIIGNIDPRNEKSAGILKKFNFEREAYFKENYFFEGKFLDTEIYTLFNPVNNSFT